jgi:hypothetical protein
LSIRRPNSLRRIHLDFPHDLTSTTDIDHLTAQPDLTSPAGNDFFSTSLHHLSHHLRRLHLRVVAEETLFWPKSNCTPSWPNLESLVVVFHMVSPSGHWYFTGPDGESRSTAVLQVTDASYPPLEMTSLDEDIVAQIEAEGDMRNTDMNTRFRVVPNDTTLRPFLAAFAKAASRMSALREAALWCPLAWRLSGDYGPHWADLLSDDCKDTSKVAWGLHYKAEGQPRSSQKESSLTEVPVFPWSVGMWCLDDELHKLFQQIGQAPWVDGLEEHWAELENRGYFESLVQREDGWIPLPN